MSNEIKHFRLTNLVLASAIALLISGCGEESLTNPPTTSEPPTTNPPTTNPGTDFVIFQDQVNSAWPAWDCCGGTTPINPVELGDYGIVTEFTVGATPAVLGFVRSQSAGPLDISAYQAKGTVEFDIKLMSAPIAGPTNWFIKLESNGGAINAGGEEAEVSITSPQVNTWQKVSIPVADLANLGLDLTSVDNFLIYPAWGTGEGAVYRVDNIKFILDGVTEPQPDPDPTPRPDADSGLKLDLTQAVTDFGGSVSQLGVADPAVLAAASSSSQIIKTTKTDGAETWAGTTLGDLTAIPFADDRQKVSVWIYSEESSIPVLLKLEDQNDGEKFVEALATTTIAGAWEKVTFDFSLPHAGTVDSSVVYDKKSIFFDFGQPGTGTVFYWDDMTFVDADSTTNPDEPDLPTEPDQITLFSDAANPKWVAWDCCGGSTPSVITDSDSQYGAVTEFVINGPTVVGFSSRADAGAVDGQPIDVSAWQDKGTVSFDLKLTNDAGATDWKFKLESASAATAVEMSLAEAPELNTWKHYQISLNDLANAGLDLANIDLLMIFPAWGSGIGSSYLVDNVVFSSTGATSPSDPTDPPLPPTQYGTNLLINGDFSSNKLDPWYQVGAGSVEVIDGVLRTAAYSGGEARIKQQRIGAGQLTANQSVTVTFKMKGELSDGGVVNGIVHTESPAGVSGTEVLSLPAPTSEWVEHSFTFNIGNDPEWGLGLTLGGVCGAVDSCTAKVEFDDIRLTAVVTPPPTDPDSPNPDLPPVDNTGNLLVNGDFATDKLDPWFQVGGGSVSLINGSVRTSAGSGGEARIKQQRIGQGTLVANQSVTVTFNMKGQVTDGGVVNGVVHTESPAGVSGTEVLSLPAPTNEWVEHSFTFNIGNDPEWGLGFTLGGVCGAVAGCSVAVDFDNIRLTAN
ncbi:carbohydrate binding domain-containing protein [Vibrio navarrensis]|uniref:carbohydrate binding domain-containing protein n=1 Tax=Vibrio navarrensis TaxID=29495 RepID=UPI0018DD7619|nr:carbohydrate binding domain-containing protein [Vibrio navarrensis]MBH9739115.1 hypothetical protein [Vibrio navarrensis]